MNSTPFSLLAFLVLAATLISACSTSRSVTDGDFSRSSVSKETVVSSIPDYSEELKTLSGKGRALVSEPGNSDRVTIDFEANRQLSLLTIQNRIGIEGGQMLVDQDSILIYNRLDKEAQKISIYDGRMTSLNELTSINILDLINFRVSEEEVNSVLESNNSYQLRLKDGSRVFVNKENGWVEQVIQNRRGSAPYSEIIYESYGELEGFKLPRKITIFSSDGNSRVVFLVRSLNVNPNNLKLIIDIPESIKIERS
ncbi:DUF4292 domain-containing protein [Gracilimonas halophila]|uniref:DUF4292 domain-containing protein n=1 Tax=Gracilimonas halophila TaxID=1834464 RepID=A0ABW5JF96_9BACT